MKLPLTITDRGLAALVDARGGATNSITISALGLTATPFVMSPTLTALPGEAKRLTTISGNAVSENVIHLVANDDSADTYTVTGIGLFLATGELFGVFSLNAGDDALFQKAPSATFLFAADITFQAGDATLINFGDSNFLNPPATETVMGVAMLATHAEVLAGTDPEKMVTPAALANIFVPLTDKGVANGVATLDANGRVPPVQLPPISSIDTFQAASEAAMLALPATPGDFCQRTDLTETFILTNSPASTLANWTQFLAPGAPVQTVNGKIGQVVISAADVGAVAPARRVNSSGLVNGGGDLSADRTLNVDIATADEALAGVINNKAVTPAALASILAAIGGKATLNRLINTAGLATGGGDLTADRTITVPKGTSADVEGLVDDAKALTAKALAGTLRSIGYNGYLRIPGTPLILQWGESTFMFGNNVSRTFYFPVAFPNACFQVLTQWYSTPDDQDDADEDMVVSQRAREYFVYQAQSCDVITFAFSYFAIGY